MPWKRLLLALTLSLNLALAGLAAPEVQTVTVDGEAAIGSDPARAREEAVAQANRLAVEQAMGVYVVSETEIKDLIVVKDTILTKASGYISGYKILSESKANGIYKVKIQATVSVAPLVDQLAKLGLLRDWTVAVVLVSNAGVRASNEAAKTRLNEFMLTRGFKLADNQALVALNDPEVLKQLQKGNYMAAVPILRDQGVDVLVVGTTLTRANAEGAIETYGGIKTIMTQGQLDARLVRIDTGEILAAKSFQGVAGGSSQDIAESKAIEKAAGLAGEYFSLEIAKLPAATSAVVQLTIRGLNFNRERAFRAALGQVPGLRKISRAIYRNQIAQYELEYQGKSDSLAEALADAALLKPFKFDITSVSSGAIEANAK